MPPAESRWHYIMTYRLQVIEDVYTLVQEEFLYTQEFHREYKYTLGQDMKRDAIQLVRSIYRANNAKDRVVYLETFLDDFELLKFEIRLSVDMKILEMKILSIPVGYGGVLQSALSRTFKI